MVLRARAYDDAHGDKVARGELPSVLPGFHAVPPSAEHPKDSFGWTPDHHPGSTDAVSGSDGTVSGAAPNFARYPTLGSLSKNHTPFYFNIGYV